MTNMTIMTDFRKIENKKMPDKVTFNDKKFSPVCFELKVGGGKLYV